MASTNPIIEPPTTVVNILTAINVLVFFYYSSSNINLDSICNKDLLSVIKQTFTHLDTTHLIVNLVALNSLSYLERMYGTPLFTYLVGAILVLDIGATYLINKLTPMTCSIGFSGIIFGLYMYQYFKTKQITPMMIFSALAFVAQPSLVNPKASLVGHLIGAVSGFVISFFL